MNQFNDTKISGDLFINKDGEETNVKESIDTINKTLFDKIYPVGSIYLSITYVSPAELFGGIWEQIKDKFLLGAGGTYAIGATGGETEHTLTIQEIPAHTHTLTGFDYGQDWGGGNAISAYSSAQYPWIPSTSSTGGSQSHNNMPPYVGVYMWKRTA